MKNEEMMIEQLDARFEMEMVILSAIAVDMSAVSTDQAEEAACCENYTCTVQLPK